MPDSEIEKEQLDSQPKKFWRRCERCGYRGDVIYVHGHGQCPTCHNSIDPCCEGQASVKVDARS